MYLLLMPSSMFLLATGRFVSGECSRGLVACMCMGISAAGCVFVWAGPLRRDLQQKCNGFPF